MSKGLLYLNMKATTPNVIKNVHNYILYQLLVLRLQEYFSMILLKKCQMIV